MFSKLIIIQNVSWAANRHIKIWRLVWHWRLEEWCWNSALWYRNQLHFKIYLYFIYIIYIYNIFIVIINLHLLLFLLYFDKMKAALVSISDVFQKHKKYRQSGFGKIILVATKFYFLLQTSSVHIIWEIFSIYPNMTQIAKVISSLSKIPLHIL